VKIAVSFAALALAALPALSETAPAPAAPPVATQVPKTVSWHGESFSDPYFWLREKADPGVKAYLDAENAWTDAVMKPTEAFQKTLYDELLSHVKETDLSASGPRRGSSTRSGAAGARRREANPKGRSR